MVRAVHIEVTHALDTDSFLNALRRFISRRGSPKCIYSDNGTNSTSGERELRTSIRSFNEDKISGHLTQLGVAWHFNPPTASHMGGVWERLIRSTRRILKSLLGEQVVSDEVLVTVMAEVESILNSRPLTKLSLDPRDEEPLSPNHLLLLRSNASVPPGVFESSDSYGRKRWCQAQYFANQFWGRWLREYLPLLQLRQKWYRSSRNFQVGDLVLVANESSPRGQWPLGRVVVVLPDDEGIVCQVEVRVGTKVLKRPIAKLCLLEMASEGDSEV